MPPELARKSQPSRTRPTSKNASAVLAAMLSVCDSNGCDDSVDWTDMVFPLDVTCFSRPRSSPDGRRLRRLAKRCGASLLVRTIRAKGHATLRVWSTGRSAPLKGLCFFIMVHRRQIEGDFE